MSATPAESQLSIRCAAIFARAKNFALLHVIHRWCVWSPRYCVYLPPAQSRSSVIRQRSTTLRFVMGRFYLISHSDLLFLAFGVGNRAAAFFRRLFGRLDVGLAAANAHHLQVCPKTPPCFHCSSSARHRRLRGGCRDLGRRPARSGH